MEPRGRCGTVPSAGGRGGGGGGAGGSSAAGGLDDEEEEEPREGPVDATVRFLQACFIFPGPPNWEVLGLAGAGVVVVLWKR